MMKPARLRKLLADEASVEPNATAAAKRTAESLNRGLNGNGVGEFMVQGKKMHG